MNPVPGVTGFGSGTLTATAPADCGLAVRFYDRDSNYLTSFDISPGQTLEFAEQGSYLTVAMWLPVPIRRRDPAEAAERIRAGYREHGIPDDIAEAMIEETLKP